jgi:hypothetical protein
MDADWFDPNNNEAKDMRKHCVQAALFDMKSFFTEHSNGVAVYDSINETHEMRQEVVKIVRTSSPF